MAEEKIPRKRSYTYYVVPKDMHTNNVLAQHFEECGFKNTADGQRPFLYWTTDYSLIDFIQRSRQEANLIFKVYIQEGNGRIRIWPFDAAKKNRKPKQTKAA